MDYPVNAVTLPLLTSIHRLVISIDETSILPEILAHMPNLEELTITNENSTVVPLDPHSQALSALHTIQHHLYFTPNFLRNFFALTRASLRHVHLSMHARDAAFDDLATTLLSSASSLETLEVTQVTLSRDGQPFLLLAIKAADPTPTLLAALSLSSSLRTFTCPCPLSCLLITSLPASLDLLGVFWPPLNLPSRVTASFDSLLRDLAREAGAGAGALLLQLKLVDRAHRLGTGKRWWAPYWAILECGGDSTGGGQGWGGVEEYGGRGRAPPSAPPIKCYVPIPFTNMCLRAPATR